MVDIERIDCGPNGWYPGWIRSLGGAAQARQPRHVLPTRELALRSQDTSAFTRRALLGRAALGASSALATRALPAYARPGARRRTVPLPSPRQVRADFTRMVEFGPRLTASESHNRYVAWLEREFTAAGLELLPCDGYETERWLAEGAW